MTSDLRRFVASVFVETCPCSPGPGLHNRECQDAAIRTSFERRVPRRMSRFESRYLGFIWLMVLLLTGRGWFDLPDLEAGERLRLHSQFPVLGSGSVRPDEQGVFPSDQIYDEFLVLFDKPVGHVMP